MSDTLSLTLQPDGRKVKIAPQTTVIQALDKLNVLIRSDCGGTGVCGKCRIVNNHPHALSSPSAEEERVLGYAGGTSTFRLACQAEIIGEASISLPETTVETAGAWGKNLQKIQFAPEPSVRRIFIKPEKLSSDLSRVFQLRNILTAQNVDCTEFDNSVFENTIRKYADVLLSGHGVTLVVHEERGITTVLAGNRPKSLGLAVDLGTTTIAVYLCDLRSGELLASSAALNPQRRYGDDVISRISVAVNNDYALLHLQKSVVAVIDRLAARCLAESKNQGEEIDEVVVVGNTTMQTIFTGTSPESLGRSPYLPAISDAQNLKAGDLGLDLRPETNVYIFPVISGFLGGDAVAAALGCDLMEKDQLNLVIDIGTNGEVLLGNKDQLLVTSCATGPALEGASISCGMRAMKGAIDRVEVDVETGKLICRTIGEEEGCRPLGICGSGLIDAMAALRKIGVLLESGRLRESSAGVVCDESGIGKAYVLVPTEESGTGEAITITLADVRAFQLAKSALAVGVEKLVEQLDVKEVQHTLITGAFGAHFNWQNGVAVGMLPEIAVCGEVASVKNLAGVGAMMALLDRKKRRMAEKIARHSKCVDLAMDPDFNERFVMSTVFPLLKN